MHGSHSAQPSGVPVARVAAPPRSHACRRARPLPGLALILGCLLPQVGWAQKGGKDQHPLVRGVVVDSSNAPIGNAEVSALRGGDTVALTTRTDAKGGFALRGLAAGGPYVFAARKVGFARGASAPVTLRPTDTLNIRFTLDTVATTLPTVTVIGKIDPAYRIDAEELARHPVLDALDAVLTLRPRMLGDAYKECRPDTSHLTVRPPRVFVNNLPRMADPSDTLGRQPTRIYVNGIEHGELGMKDILAEIPVEDIAEMRYVDCWDTSVPARLRNALFVVLKPGKRY